MARIRVKVPYEPVRYMVTLYYISDKLWNSIFFEEVELYPKTINEMV